MRDLMIDLETMGTGPDGAIVSFGAVFFDENGLGDEMYRSVNLATAVREGGELDASTVMWWLGQDDATRNAVRFGGVDIKEALGDLHSFIVKRAGTEAKVWGCSPTFDCLKIERAMKRIGMKTPWKYFNERCYRTVRERNALVEQDERTGLHNALDDAKFQARHLIKIMKAQRAIQG